MKSEVELWEACLREAGLQHHVRIHRDLETSRSRIKHEGLAFLTITLTRFEKDLLRALSLGRIDSNLFLGFRRKGGLPVFLSGFLRQMFDGKGVLRCDFDPSVLRSTRQVLLLLSKVEYPVSAVRKREAVKAYVATDERLVELSDRLKNIFRSAARGLLWEYLSCVEQRVLNRDFLPRHSTGVLATRESSNGRWANTTWTERLQEVLRWEDDLALCPSEVYHYPDEISVLARHEEPAAKLVLVPKTMKGPRVIVEEPVYNQYVQQGIFHVMSDVLAEKRFRNLSDSFSWASQDPNRDLAQLGSQDGAYCTIDLSEASDRVSFELVNLLLDSVPFLRSAIFASRSEYVDTGEFGTIRLNKFASMGSSLCFPIESMVFYVIASIALADSQGAIAPSMFRSSSKYDNVRVYGDDIIVPQIAAQSSLSWLESYGLKVNVDKTFTTGYFRESCGSDWYRGKDVSVFKLRQPLPAKKRHIERLRSAIAFHNHAYSMGWFRVADHVSNSLDAIFGRIPRVPQGLDTTALWTLGPPTAVRRHPKYQSPSYRTLVFREVLPRDEVAGYGALKKSLTVMGSSSGGLPFTAASTTVDDHLMRNGRSRCVGVNIGWTG